MCTLTSSLGDGDTQLRRIGAPWHGRAGLPDVLVLDRATRFTTFTGAIWTGPARGNALLIFASQHLHSILMAERVNGVVANVRRSSASERADDWPTILRLVQFAVHDSASHLGTG